jgi:enoyl-CoA hydratase/carnithine racemase
MRGQGEKAFCAGGDIRGNLFLTFSFNFPAIYDAKVAGKGSSTTPQDFFGEEYVLNYMISKKNVTQVALLNGITSNSLL